MWIKKEEYELLKNKEKRLEDLQITILAERKIHSENSKIMTEKYYNSSKELYEIKKELEHYLNTNEEKGVVYIPKFVVEKIVHGL
jgi:hypothetical protein